MMTGHDVPTTDRGVARVDRWVLARHRRRDDLVGITLIWAGWLVFVTALTLVVSVLRSIEVSGWEVGAQVPRWFAGGVGIQAAAVYAPLYIAHGYTRREIARQLSVATAGAILLLSALMTVGYMIERAVYAVAGWPQEMTQDHLFSSLTDYPMIFVEFGLLFTVWVVAGALVGTAIYRHPANGLLVIPVGIVMIGLAEAVLNPGFFELVTRVMGSLGVDPGGVSVTASLAVAVGSVVVALPVTWLLFRDMPLRSGHN